MASTKRSGARPTPRAKTGASSDRRRSGSSRPPRGARKSDTGPSHPTFTVFLDRDGVFNVNPKTAVFRRNGFRWLPGAKEAFQRLNRPGIQTCLATNQPFLGTWTLGLRAGPVNRALQHHLAEAGGRLDRVEHSLAPPWFGWLGVLGPARLKRAFRRRKPGPGMLEDGAAAFGNVDKSRAVMVGDKLKDAQAAARYGIPSILLATTHSKETLRRGAARRNIPVHAIVPGLAEAVDAILAMASPKR